MTVWRCWWNQTSSAGSDFSCRKIEKKGTALVQCRCWSPFVRAPLSSCSISFSRGTSLGSLTALGIWTWLVVAEGKPKLWRTCGLFYWASGKTHRTTFCGISGCCWSSQSKPRMFDSSYCLSGCSSQRTRCHSTFFVSKSSGIMQRTLCFWWYVPGSSWCILGHKLKTNVKLWLMIFTYCCGGSLCWISHFGNFTLCLRFSWTKSISKSAFASVVCICHLLWWCAVLL